MDHGSLKGHWHQQLMSKLCCCVPPDAEIFKANLRILFLPTLLFEMRFLKDVTSVMDCCLAWPCKSNSFLRSRGRLCYQWIWKNLGHFVLLFFFFPLSSSITRRLKTTEHFFKYSHFQGAFGLHFCFT